jgi:hypothetical protein
MVSRPPEPDTVQDAPDPRIARTEERLAMLRELSELGMALTRNLARRALERPAPPEPPASAPSASAASATPPAAPPAAASPRHDPADSFAKLSRAVRLTVALETRTDDDLASLRAGGTGRAAHGPLDRPDREAGDGPDAEEAEDLADDIDDLAHEPPPRDHGSPRRNRIRDLVFDAINAEITDAHRAREVLDALHERLIEGEHYDAVVFGPIQGAVEAVCDDLGLHPDWRRWTGEDWLPPPEAPSYRWQNVWAPGVAVAARRRQ